VDDTATLVSFTLLGDSNLDRSVNFVDLVHLAQSYGVTAAGTTWLHGDFTYDGRTAFEDLVALAQNYNRSMS
jgi:hypothetical protein